jgi:hypothetical protein
MKETIEKQVSDAVLQEPVKVTAGGREYTVARPSVATLIEVSKLTGSMQLGDRLDGDNPTSYALAYARDCGKAVGDIAATLILGKKGILVKEKRIRKYLFGLIRHTEEVEVDRREELSKELLENATGEELLNVIREAVGMQHIAFFLSIITSLNEANILRRTRKET